LPVIVQLTQARENKTYSEGRRCLPFHKGNKRVLHPRNAHKGRTQGTSTKDQLGAGYFRGPVTVLLLLKLTQQGNAT
jgi:hypothetical protein